MSSRSADGEALPLFADNRTDSLLEHFKEPATQMQSRKVHGVGMTVSAECEGYITS